MNTSTLLGGVALILVLATLPGTLYLLVLSLAGVRRRPSPAAIHNKIGEPVSRISIVVPAHNESAGIGRTLGNLLPIAQADGAATVIVVADNCTDDTAAIARALGARVLERQDTSRRGKGYALDFTFQTLASESYAGYVVIDADSVAEPNLLQAIRSHFANGAEVIQTRYTVLNADQSPRTQLAELALCAFNCLRPRGRHALGLSAGILGNGFALRQSVLDRVPYAARSVVEDLEYHLQLIEHGIRVHFADETVVRGEMPIAGAGQRTQRARWEGGRLRMLLEHGGTLLFHGLTGRFRFLEPLLDLLLLPLAYHTLLLLILLSLPVAWGQGMGVFGLAVLSSHVFLAARVGGLSWPRLARAIVQVPHYLFWKLGMLRSTAQASQFSTQWVRTERDTNR